MLCAATSVERPHQALAVDLVGLAQSAAVDQPQINMLVRNIGANGPGDPLTAQTVVGYDDNFNPITAPSINITAYLDTGSSGSLLSTSTATGYTDSTGHGIPNSTFNGQTVKFADIGVGGTANFTVSKPIVMQFAPYTPTTNDLLANAADATYAQYYPQQLNAQIEIGPSDDGSQSLTGDPLLDSILASETAVDVVGMPALTGKVMVVDARSSNSEVSYLAANGADLSSLITDPTAFANFINNLSLRTYIYNPGTPFRQDANSLASDPGIPTTNLHVKLSYADFSGFTTLTPTGAPGPNLTHNPFIGPNPLAAPGTDHTPGIKISFKVPDTANPSKLDTLTTTGSFLFDTGAGASFISDNLAAQLHVRYKAGTEGTDNASLELYDPSNPTAPGTPLANQFQESVTGIGATITIAGFYLDSLIIPTIEANPNNPNDPRNIIFSGTRTASGQQDILGPPVLVQNITATKGNQSITLDGDLGINFLAGSVNLGGDGFDPTLGGFAPGAFDWITFDEPNGVLGLKLNSTFHIAGDFNLDGKLTNADVQAMLNALKNISGFESANSLSGDDWLDIADVNRDGAVTMADLTALMQLLTGQIPSSGSGSLSVVPEPAAAELALVALGGLIALWRIRRR
jgi:hypothetical protein